MNWSDDHELKRNLTHDSVSQWVITHHHQEIKTDLQPLASEPEMAPGFPSSISLSRAIFLLNNRSFMVGLPDQPRLEQSNHYDAHLYNAEDWTDRHTMALSKGLCIGNRRGYHALLTFLGVRIQFKFRVIGVISQSTQRSIQITGTTATAHGILNREPASVCAQLTIFSLVRAVNLDANDWFIVDRTLYRRYCYNLPSTSFSNYITQTEWQTWQKKSNRTSDNFTPTLHV